MGQYNVKSVLNVVRNSVPKLGTSKKQFRTHERYVINRKGPLVRV
jgi:hypothetical protein